MHNARGRLLLRAAPHAFAAAPRTPHAFRIHRPPFIPTHSQKTSRPSLHSLLHHQPCSRSASLRMLRPRRSARRALATPLPSRSVSLFFPNARAGCIVAAACRAPGIGLSALPPLPARRRLRCHAAAALLLRAAKHSRPPAAVQRHIHSLPLGARCACPRRTYYAPPSLQLTLFTPTHSPKLLRCHSVRSHSFFFFFLLLLSLSPLPPSHRSPRRTRRRRSASPPRPPPPR